MTPTPERPDYPLHKAIAFKNTPCLIVSESIVGTATEMPLRKRGRVHQGCIHKEPLSTATNTIFSAPTAEPLLSLTRREYSLSSRGPSRTTMPNEGVAFSAARSGASRPSRKAGDPELPQKIAWARPCMSQALDLFVRWVVASDREAGTNPSIWIRSRSPDLTPGGPSSLTLALVPFCVLSGSHVRGIGAMGTLHR